MVAQGQGLAAGSEWLMADRESFLPQRPRYKGLGKIAITAKVAKKKQQMRND
jgi:hypothetical protein